MRNRLLVAGLVLAAVCGAPAVCHAQAVPFTHEGFYLQTTFGGGYLGSSASANAVELSIRGGALNGSLWLGSSVVPGFVLGGGFTSAIGLRPRVKQTLQGQQTDFGTTNTGLQLNMIGLISDIYPDPRKGLHFQAMLGYAVLTISQNGVSSESPSGVGLQGGIGSDFWVSEEWSIGVLGSVVYAAAKLHEASYPTVAPAVLASFTYN